MSAQRRTQFTTALVLQNLSKGNGPFEGWDELEYAVRTGEPPLEKIYGYDYWELLRRNPQANAAMNGAAHSVSVAMTPAVTAAYEWSQFPVIADIGGGIGTQLVSILDAAPSSKGILFDQPHLRAESISHHRIAAISGNFFESVPTGADAYLLRWILHDWAETEAAAILKTLRRSMKPKMSIHKPYLANIIAVTLAGALALSWSAFAGVLTEVTLPGERVYLESIATAPDRTLYVSSPALGGVWRVEPGASAAQEWIKPGAFDSRSTFGVLVDERANLLWVCSSDISALGIAGPSSTKGSFVKGFDLKTGEGKVTAALPGPATLCNDMAIGADGSLFVTNSLAPQILRLKPGSTELEVWLESPVFQQPAQGVGLDGIAFGGDGNIYVNTFTNGAFSASR